MLSAYTALLREESVRIRKVIFGSVGIVLGVPLVLAIAGIAWISAVDRTNGRVVSSNEVREYLLYVPESYDPAVPVPLVISIHAGATWPAQQRNLSRWNRLADENGFIVVYPSGNPQMLGVARIWHTFDRGAGLDRDVRFISELIDTLRSTYNIDQARIYADGMSNGGGLAFVLSCALSDRIAAVGMVAPAQSLPPDWCAATRPVAMIAFHGTADPIVPYGGGRLGDPLNPVKPVFPAIRDFVAGWAERNGCGAEPSDESIAADVTRLYYADCAGSASVVLYTVSGGGHTWPGGKPLPEWRVGPNSNGIDATREMWAFFREHPLLASSM
ncbi:MAG TPA: PHB depolymerase family esterase [Longimicrobiales bacterium]